MINALVTDAKTKLAQQVKDGHLTQAQADRIQTDLVQRITERVNNNLKDHHGLRGPGGPVAPASPVDRGAAAPTAGDRAAHPFPREHRRRPSWSAPVSRVGGSSALQWRPSASPKLPARGHLLRLRHVDEHPRARRARRRDRLPAGVAVRLPGPLSRGLHDARPLRRAHHEHRARTGVLIPSLRHPMTAAASIATLADLAPGRVEIGVGSGFTGRYTLGKKPLPWAEVADYVRCVQALLRGEQTQWEGTTIQMLHPEGFGARRPVEVPWIIGCEGPKGQAAAHELGDGTFSPLPLAGFDRMVQLTFGTVLDEGEDPGSDRAMAAAGHAAAVILHGSFERGHPVGPRLVGPDRGRAGRRPPPRHP